MTQGGAQATVVAGPGTDVVDDASAAAAGTRTAARWIASALGSIPSLAILASLIRAPTEAGFDVAKLALGVGLAALGGILALLAFARVLTPVPLEDEDLRTLDFRRIPGQPYVSFDDLERDLDDVRGAAVEREYGVVRSSLESQRARAEADRAQAAAQAAETAVADETDGDLHQRAVEARRVADEAERVAAAKEHVAAANVAAQAVWDQQLIRRDAIRAKAYRLKAADEVGLRYRQAQVVAIVAVALIAAGIVLLALAPERERGRSGVAANVVAGRSTREES
jgi:hypothetical protein